MKNGIDQIDEERCRQISVEGWSCEHDDEHRHCELKHAAATYEHAAQHEINGRGVHTHVPIGWPWSAEWWKPKGGPQRLLVKAGALYRAEAERAARGDLPDRETYAEEMNACARRCGEKIDRLNDQAHLPPGGGGGARKEQSK